MTKNFDMQYTKKRFTNYSNSDDDVKITNMSEAERAALRKQDEVIITKTVIKPKKKKLYPFGGKILVQRQRVGDKLGSGILHAADDTKERPTEIAVVVEIPDNSFADKSLIEHAEQIITALTAKCTSGDSEALISLLRFNEYIQMKSIRVGDKLMISRYAGTDFMLQETGEFLSLIDINGIIALIVENE